MNFNDAVKAHAAWKFKLSDYIRKPDRSLSADHVCKDNQCELGKWIYSEGLSYNTLPEYTHLKTEHARFHKAAGDIIRQADSGANVTDAIALGGDSEFSKASTAVVSAIMAMQSKVTKAS